MQFACSIGHELGEKRVNNKGKALLKRVPGKIPDKRMDFAHLLLFFINFCK